MKKGEAMSDEVKEKIRKKLSGRKMREAVRERIRKKLSGRVAGPQSEEHRKKIGQSVRGVLAERTSLQEEYRRIRISNTRKKKAREKLEAEVDFEGIERREAEQLARWKILPVTEKVE